MASGPPGRLRTRHDLRAAVRPALSLWLVIGLLALVSGSPVAAGTPPPGPSLPLAPTALPASLLVVDVSSLSVEDQLTAAAMQGLVNRDGPRVYLVGLRNGQDFEIDPSASHWLDVYGIPTVTASIDDLRTLTAGVAGGLVVWDPAEPTGTQNIATTLAGRDGLIPVSPAQAAVLGAPPYDLPVVEDLRRFGFSDDLDSLRWAIDNLLAGDTYAFPVWMGRDRNRKAIQPGLRDWAVMQGGFVFDADPGTDQALIREVLGHFAPNTPVYGYPFFDTPDYLAGGLGVNEALGVWQISEAGMFLVPTTDATNLSVHSAIPAEPGAPAPRWDDRERPADDDTTYVSFIISDGDALGAVYTTIWAARWAALASTDIPIGFSISPWMTRITPRMYQWFVETAPEHVSLVAGPSGAGYAYPTLMPNLGSFLDLTEATLRDSGLRSVWLLDNAYLRSPGPETIAAYVERVDPSIIFTDYIPFEGLITPNPPAISFSSGVPVAHAVFPQTVDQAVVSIEATAGQQAAEGPGPRFVFVALNVWAMGPGEAAAVMERLGPGYEAVRPDHFAGLLASVAPDDPPVVPPPLDDPPPTDGDPPAGDGSPTTIPPRPAAAAPITRAVPKFTG